MKATHFIEIPFPEAYWITTNHLLAGPYPGLRGLATPPAKWQLLVEAGINTFIDLTEDGEARPYAHLLPSTVQHLRLPIADFTVPSPGLMHTILDELDDVLQQQRRVYLHCMGGLGRTGTVVGCYLVRHGLSGTEALARLTHLRANSALAHHRSPETEAQRQMVLHWQQGT